MRAHGVEVTAIVDLRSAEQIPEQTAQTAAGPVLAGARILAALAGTQGARVAGARVERADGAEQTLACDGIVMSVGWAGAANLLYQAGTHMQYQSAIEQFVPAQHAPGVFACGRVNGVHALASHRLDGERAGSAAAAHAGFGQARAIGVAAEQECPSHPWPIVARRGAKNFVDFDEDLRLEDLENAVQEGFDNIELLTRYSTVGMGPSQGKHSNMNALRVLARLSGKTPQEVGTTTARPFFHPVPMCILGGRGFAPERRSPLHERHQALGAVFMPAGVWQRPEYYPQRERERADCIRSEVNAVRQCAGLIDLSTLGKIEIFGAQAAEFLDRVYLSRYATLRVGMSRYAVMCDEAGTVIDDGVVARLAVDHFYFSTTTSGADTVYRELLRLNSQWGLDCGLVNHTGAYAALNLAGPRARALLAELSDLDLSEQAFPFLAVRLGAVAGCQARLLRVGFVGEWGCEIHVPARQAGALWDALMESGQRHGLRPFGVEAQRLLRLEKGHLIVGQDSDGLSNPFELGLDWAVKWDKPFFVGKRSLEILQRQPRRQRLVGFVLAEDFAEDAGTAPLECHLVIDQGALAGRVTSIAWSPTLRRHIGLALVQPALAAAGGALQIRLSDGILVAATVAPTPFYDPQALRQKAAE